MKLIDAYQDILRDLGNQKGQNTSGIILESKKTVKTSSELTFKERVDLLLPQLWKDAGKKRDRFESAIDLLSKLIKNIIENPSDEKYRHFKKVSCSLLIFIVE